VPVSLVGTFAVMYLLGFSSTIFPDGNDDRHRFVVDDAIVVMETYRATAKKE